MTRTELQNKLKQLGCHTLCDDNKTLCAYSLIQYNLKCNSTPIKYITNVYVDEYKNIRIVICDELDIESGWQLSDEE